MRKTAFKRASAFTPLENVSVFNGLKRRSSLTGFTLIEMVIVVAIIAALTVAVIATATRIQSKAKEELTANTISLLTAALSEFQSYDYSYDASSLYSDLDFPIDCNGYGYADIGTELGNALGVTVTVDVDNDANDSGCEAMYFLLSRVPQCRKILERIDRSLVTNKDSNGDDLEIIVDGRNYSLLRVIDSWGNTLRYDYYDEDNYDKDDSDNDWTRNFPVLTSSGPDGKLDTDDDISSR
ncbi:MAG: type II secretion system protein [Planctomycetes bacterium]|nr:type II secretion system protein [Planctomycetota bacterium]